MCKQEDGREDTALRVINNADHAPLRYENSELYLMTKHCSGDVIQHVSGFRYWEMGEERKMSLPDNKCGYMQRAFDFYWSIREGTQQGRIFLGVGTSSVISPSTLGTDKYCGETPNVERYVEQGFPHFRMDADKPFPFYDGQFGGVMFNHVFEHLNNQEQALKEALRVTVERGVVCVLTPDMTHNGRGLIDSTHTREFSADEFLQWVEGLNDMPEYEIVEHNTLDNDFSFNTVLRRL